MDDVPAFGKRDGLYFLFSVGKMCGIRASDFLGISDASAERGGTGNHKRQSAIQNQYEAYVSDAPRTRRELKQHSARNFQGGRAENEE